MKKIVIFIGPPGSGKGTQAKKMALEHNYGYISTGDLLRNLAKQPVLNADEQQAVVLMSEGKLVPDWLIYNLVFGLAERELKNKNGLIFDGAIRNVAQAQEHQNFFERQHLQNEVVVVDIELTEEEATRRLVGRSQVEMRSDDNAETIKKRMELQGNKALAPIREFYKKIGMLKRIDGSKSIPEVEAAIDQAIQ